MCPFCLFVLVFCFTAFVDFVYFQCLIPSVPDMLLWGLFVVQLPFCVVSCFVFLLHLSFCVFDLIVLGFWYVSFIVVFVLFFLCFFTNVRPFICCPCSWFLSSWCSVCSFSWLSFVCLFSFPCSLSLSVCPFLCLLFFHGSLAFPIVLRISLLLV